MRQLRELTNGELQTAYDTVMTEAFPPQELKPVEAMFRLREMGRYAPLGYFEDDRPIGYICLWLDGDYILIDYLCVPRDMRNGGIGAEIIKAAVDAYPEGTVFIGESEAPDGGAEDGIRSRRLAFYARNGAKMLGYDTALFGVHYKTIVWAKKLPSEEEILFHHDQIYRKCMAPEIYEAAIQIPLGPGEEVRRFDAWRE